MARRLGGTRARSGVSRGARCRWRLGGPDLRGRAQARSRGGAGAHRSTIVSGTAGRDPVRQQHQSRHSRPGRDVQRDPVRSGVTPVFAAVSRPRRAEENHGDDAAWARVRRRRRCVRTRVRRVRRGRRNRHVLGDGSRRGRSRRSTSWRSQPNHRQSTRHTHRSVRTPSQRFSSRRGRRVIRKASSTRSECSVRTS